MTSIKEALPTEQLSIAGYLTVDGHSKAYYQVGESHVNFDEAGTFDNEIVNNKNLVAAGNFGSPANGQSAGCAYHLI